MIKINRLRFKLQRINHYPNILGFIGIVVLAASIRAFIVGRLPAALYWDSASYIDFAEYIVSHRTLPPLGIRSPGYPFFLILAGGVQLDLSQIVFIQQVMGVGSTCLIYLSVLRALRTWRWAFCCAALFTLSVDILFMEVTIYSETLITFFLCSLAYLLILGNSPSNERSIYWLIAGVVSSFLLITRPVMQLIPMMIVLCMVLMLVTERVGIYCLSKLGWKQVVIYMFVPALVWGSYGLFNLSESGFFRLALGRGFSLLNYVGHPQLYRRLPPELSHITSLYEKQALMNPGRSYFGWGEMLEPIIDAQRQMGFYYQDWDEAAFLVASRAILYNPTGYLRVWLPVFIEFNTSYFVWHGLFATPEVEQDLHNAQIVSYKYEIVRFLEKAWRIVQPLLSLLSLISESVICVIFLKRKIPRTSKYGALYIWAIFFVITLTSTAIEPSPGQARYRMPWQGLMLILAFITCHELHRFNSRATLSVGIKDKPQ